MLRRIHAISWRVSPRAGHADVGYGVSPAMGPSIQRRETMDGQSHEVIGRPRWGKVGGYTKRNALVELSM